MARIVQHHPDRRFDEQRGENHVAWHALSKYLFFPFVDLITVEFNRSPLGPLRYYFAPALESKQVCNDAV